ncbi:uncharacterized protein LOC123876334 isoform X1 [Maniola jurtina]|uniref:uncharacterized protein LOC123876334 isoform X1 n=1 Tax=Maniola jurtina TaxID=191418 RepID=UPI001E68C951|nr:uncharacterized protein LOC123876334 isoform X1 [Maniola jurtina]
MGIKVRPHHHAATLHYIRSSQLFHTNLCRAPALFLLSSSDPVGAERSNRNVYESWVKMGIKVRPHHHAATLHYIRSSQLFHTNLCRAPALFLLSSSDPVGAERSNRNVYESWVKMGIKVRPHHHAATLHYIRSSQLFHTNLCRAPALFLLSSSDPVGAERSNRNVYESWVKMGIKVRPHHHAATLHYIRSSQLFHTKLCRAPALFLLSSSDPVGAERSNRNVYESWVKMGIKVRPHHHAATLHYIRSSQLFHTNLCRAPALFLLSSSDPVGAERSNRNVYESWVKMGIKVRPHHHAATLHYIRSSQLFHTNLCRAPALFLLSSSDPVGAERSNRNVYESWVKMGIKVRPHHHAATLHYIRSSQLFHTKLCRAPALFLLSSSDPVGAERSNRNVYESWVKMGIKVRPHHHAATLHYIRSSQLFHTNLCRAPALFLLSSSDPVGAERSNRNVYESWVKMGIKVRPHHHAATLHYIRSSQLFHTNLCRAPALFLLSSSDPVGAERSNRNVYESWVKMGIKVRPHHHAATLHYIRSSQLFHTKLCRAPALFLLSSSDPVGAERSNRNVYESWVKMGIKVRPHHHAATLHYIRSSQLFHTKLCRAPALFLLSSSDPVGAERSNRNVYESWVKMGIKVRPHHHAATLHYIRSSQLFHTKLCRAPALFLLSSSDPVGAERSNRNVYESWVKMGIKCTWQCWDRSPHVQHFTKHRDEYVALVRAHIRDHVVLAQQEKSRAHA